MRRVHKGKYIDDNVVKHVIDHLTAEYKEPQPIIDAIFATYQDDDGNRDRDTIARNWNLLLKNYQDQRPITYGFLDEFIRPFGCADVEEYVSDFLPGVDERLFIKTRQALAELEHDAQEVLDHSPALYADKFYLGNIIECRRFNMEGKGLANKGIDLRHVSVIDEGYSRKPESSLIDLTVTPLGANNTKYCLHKIEPADLLDAQHDSLDVHIFHSDYYTYYRCQNSVYDCNKNNKNKRLQYGHIDPRKNKIPQLFTMFFTVILDDGQILLMRRSSNLTWYPNMFDLSGSENFNDQDLAAEYSLENCINRGIIEEYFPSIGLDQQAKLDVINETIGLKRLMAVGYHTESCSYPFFAICRLKVDEPGYVEILNRIKTNINPHAQFDKEGELYLTTIQNIRELLKEGSCPIRPLKFKGGLNASVRFADESELGEQDKIILSAEELHPMTAYRMGLILDCC
ncbi:MAG: hypothetical protein DHS20C08_11630 [Rhodomicrobium sp.]|nr:MAG: hypothetical protein DHS20C08_11630 [Rhodomicrobium sp.]